MYWPQFPHCISKGLSCLHLSTGAQVSKTILLNVSLTANFLRSREAINLADLWEYPARLAASAPFIINPYSKQNLSHLGCLRRKESGSRQKAIALVCPLGLPFGLADGIPRYHAGLPLLFVNLKPPMSLPNYTLMVRLPPQFYAQMGVMGQWGQCFRDMARVSV